LCIDRLTQDEQPACSLVCPTGCISFGDRRSASERPEKKIAGEGARIGFLDQ
jgi:Fe-S-cluster-containing dehydrogenase component